jgi:hypothetical protein
MWLVALGLMGFLIYFRGIDIPYYADDFLFFSGSSCSNVLDRFLGKARHMGFYRPIEAAFLTCIQEYFGLNTIPIHIATISLHTVLSYLVFVFLLKVGFSRTQAILGSLFMLFSQANASAVLGNDTLSQVSGTFFGCLSLWFLYISFPNGQAAEAMTDRTYRVRNYCISVLAFTIALFSKESSVSFFPLLFGIIAFHVHDIKTKVEKTSLRDSVLAFLPYVVILAAYLTTRSSIGATQLALGHERYNFHIGRNVVENLALLFVASVIPLSSVTVFTSVKSGEISMIAFSALASVLFIVLLADGLWMSARHGLIFLLGAFGIGALFPMVLLNQVSELYAYNSMPFVSMIAGISLGTLFHFANTHRSKQMLAVTLVVLFASHIIAVNQKSSLMQENGARATMLLAGIQPYAQRLSKNGELLLLNPDDSRPEYSVFLMRGFNVLSDGLSRIKETSNRNDISVRIIEEKDLNAARHDGHDSVILYLDGDFIRVMGQSANVSSALGS